MNLQNKIDFAKPRLSASDVRLLKPTFFVCLFGTPSDKNLAICFRINVLGILGLVTTYQTICKEVQIVYRLFLVNCYLLHVPRLPFSQLSETGG